MCAIRSFFLPAVLSIVFVSGCAPQTEITKLYEDRSSANVSYTRLFIVDVSSDVDLRRDFENKLVSRLKSAGTDGVASYTRLENNDGLLRDDINRSSAEAAADAILITHIVSLESKVEREEGREEIIRTCRGGDPADYFLYDNKVLKEPDSVKLALSVVVVSNLYDAKSGERIWTIQSTCFDKENLHDVLLDEAKAIVQQLRLDHLI